MIGEFDTNYQAVRTNLQNNSDQEYPLIETVLNLLSYDLAEKLRMRNYLQDSSKLFKYNLLEHTSIEACTARFSLKSAVKVNLLGNASRRM